MESVPLTVTMTFDFAASISSAFASLTKGELPGGFAGEIFVPIESVIDGIISLDHVGSDDCLKMIIGKALPRKPQDRLLEGGKSSWMLIVRREPVTNSSNILSHD